MKYVDEFRSRSLVTRLARQIKAICPQRQLNIMEVCGTHTQNFFRFGLDKILPPNIRFIAGPGCPVCVSPASFIDAAVHLARNKNNIILTFGDMLRIPGTNSSLEKEKACGADVRVVYSAFDSLEVAKRNLSRTVIFLAVGFETTAPTVAACIITAKKEKLKNLFFLTALRLIPAAMRHLSSDRRLKLSGFLCPGHVTAIIGSRAYEPIASGYKIPCCVAGFEPVDILEGIYLLLRRINAGSFGVDNQYARVVRRCGNIKARSLMRCVFMEQDASWRGLGVIPDSGLGIRKEFAAFDAEKFFSLRTALDSRRTTLNKCKCGDVLKGLISPKQCPLFGSACRPEHPVGPCMVSSEGACNAYYKYR